MGDLDGGLEREGTLGLLAEVLDAEEVWFDAKRQQFLLHHFALERDVEREERRSTGSSPIGGAFLDEIVVCFQD